VLARIEELLRHRHGEPELRLADYFDLIAGTSTGAIIAATLARGMSVAEVQELYRKLASQIFQKSLFRQGLFRAKYDAAALTDILQREFGNDTLGSDNLRTGLLVVAKRADTGSPWPMSNNPKGKYFDPKRQFIIPNKDYPLWAVVRASTAAPAYFEPEFIRIAQAPDGTAVTGTFMDGGISTANNPALVAFRFATLKGYRIDWPTGEDRILLVSVGTGTTNPNAVPSNVPGKAAVKALLALMDDCNEEVETTMQWLGRSHTAKTIDREIGTLEGDELGGKKLLTYQRYNVELSGRGINQTLEAGLTPLEIDSVQEMDAPENIPILDKIGKALGKRISPEHFPNCFDLTANLEQP
jgi:predicted acylesterase/phospholipase RssA